MREGWRGSEGDSGLWGGEEGRGVRVEVEESSGVSFSGVIMGAQGWSFSSSLGLRGGGVIWVGEEEGFFLMR